MTSSRAVCRSSRPAFDPANRGAAGPYPGALAECILNECQHGRKFAYSTGAHRGKRFQISHSIGITRRGGTPHHLETAVGICRRTLAEVKHPPDQKTRLQISVRETQPGSERRTVALAGYGSVVIVGPECHGSGDVAGPVSGHGGKKLRVLGAFYISRRGRGDGHVFPLRGLVIVDYFFTHAASSPAFG